MTAAPVVPPATRNPVDQPPIIIGIPDGLPAYFINLEGRFDRPLVVELPASKSNQKP